MSDNNDGDTGSGSSTPITRGNNITSTPRAVSGGTQGTIDPITDKNTVTSDGGNKGKTYGIIGRLYDTMRSKRSGMGDSSSSSSSSSSGINRLSEFATYTRNYDVNSVALAAVASNQATYREKYQKDDIEKFKRNEHFEEMITALMERLEITNGQDSYEATSVASGKLNKSEWMLVPNDMDEVDIGYDRIGAGDVYAEYSYDDVLQVFALNYMACPDKYNDYRLQYALIRMEAFKMGYYKKQKETLAVPPLSDNEMLPLINILTGVNDEILSAARVVAFLTPLMCEFVFRQMGHHYITADQLTYDDKYNRLTKSCLAADSFSKFNAPMSMKFHTMLHWVSPAVAYEVLRAQLHTERIPDALKVRATAMPAGCALLSITDSAFNAALHTDFIDTVHKNMGVDPAIMKETSKKISKDPARYHKYAFAYGKSPLPDEDKAEFEQALSDATRLGPITKGIIDALSKDASIARSKAILKFAGVSPIITLKVVRYFRGLIKSKVMNPQDIFAIRGSKEDEEE